ncbi:hypothetical protein M441DRAFT_70068 [Trichoderma asperellum CBS 433.97]|uniref:Uncharacterized protein n=1 Tax=Trichoderma asperellum (strain ATCC 204424 / CBS 433.97 / NBRC 101777) TaxID=1042311 RepID=A0A2T3Z5Z2_TRIA4|nr:hypothetical protein M441DRAFT_70068 [Trichoderma asperellum CBS 433.97]PTB40241.1 hypothetical protein M441DRAFT_70068 [Trichoderma asperellum CBS 433.97]
MAPSMNTLMASANPCPSPQIPPIRFDLEDLPDPNFRIKDAPEQRCRAERALHAYWAQAANMTKADQEIYIQLLKNCSFVVQVDAIDDPREHPLYKDLATNPSWPKYVMLKAIYGPEILSQKLMVELEIDLEPIFGSLDIKDLTSTYLQGHVAKRKREEESETEDNEEIPSRIVKKQSPEIMPSEQTPVTTTQTQPSRSSAQNIATPTLSPTVSPSSSRAARRITMGEALSNQDALLKRRCDALEASVADLRRKVDASHMNVIVLLTTILERVGRLDEGIDAIRRELGL